MSYAERSFEILKYLKTHKRATVEDLAQTLYVSKATIRRDLHELQKAGQIERSHGGAIFSEGTDELSIFVRQAKNAKEKIQAVTIALKYLPDFQTVFIDNSSTCLALANRLNLSHKTVVTNGLHMAINVYRQADVSLILLGGEMRGHTTAVMGGMTLSNLRDFRFDLALLSASAVDTEGSYELALDAMQIKRAAISQSKKKILIFDQTKVNQCSPYRTAELGVYDALITDAEDGELEQLRAAHPCVYNK